MEMPFLEWRSLYVNEERIGRGRMVLYPWLYLSSICRGNGLSAPWIAGEIQARLDFWCLLLFRTLLKTERRSYLGSPIERPDKYWSIQKF